MGKFLDAAEIVLGQAGGPLRVRVITDTAIENQLLDFSGGATPSQTMKAKLSVDIRVKGKRSRFMRTGPGRFALRDRLEPEYQARPFEKTAAEREDVLVVRPTEHPHLFQFHGLRRSGARHRSLVLDSRFNMYVPRKQAELTARFKQIVSYVLVVRDGNVLRFERGAYTSARALLKGRLCIGFGGHVQAKDFELFSLEDSGYFASVARELNEELNLPVGAVSPQRLRPFAVINDRSSDVGDRHFALVDILDLSDLPELAPPSKLKREKSINQLTWVPFELLGAEFERYEYWSKLCIKAAYRALINVETRVYVRSRATRLADPDAVVAVVGQIGSGKSEACHILADGFGFSPINSGEVLRELANLPEIADVGREAFQESASEFMVKEDGYQRLADQILGRISPASGRVVIDGIRNHKTLAHLREALGERLTTLYVESTPDDAFHFYRRREGRDISFVDFRRLLTHPTEREVPRMGEAADIVVYNHAGLASYRTTLRSFLRTQLG